MHNRFPKGPTTPKSQETHATKYRLEGESFEEFVRRFSQAVGDSPEHTERVAELVMHQAYLPAGRQQLAMGNPANVTAVNCLVSSTIIDDTEEIHRAVGEAISTMRMGGGIGMDFSTIRPKGHLVKSMNTRSSGPVSFMGLWDKGCEVIMSQGLRRGAMMGVLRVDHPDIMEFIHAKKVRVLYTEEGERVEIGALTNFNMSVAITDAFMEALENDAEYDLVFQGRRHGKLRAREVWDAIMLNTWDYAEPGVLFIDTINRMNPLGYCEVIAATNPCVTGDTPILTKEFGYRPIEALVGQEVHVWNGCEWSLVSPRETGQDQPILKVLLSTGQELKVTPYHTMLRPTVGDEFEKVLASNLFVGDRLVASEGPDRAVLEQYPRVVSISEGGIAKSVYCFTEPKRNLGVFDGILTGNCGEQALPPNGACVLGSLNLTRYLRGEVPGQMTLDFDQLAKDMRVAVRATDNIISRTKWPLPAQEAEGLAKRRMGLGPTAVGNALELAGCRYGSPQFLELLRTVLKTMLYAAIEESCDLAEEKGCFPAFNAEKWLSSGFGQTLPDRLKDLIRKKGLRNGQLMSIAPTGTISLCADNVSSGIEPPYKLDYSRTIIGSEGSSDYDMKDWAYREYGYECATADDISVDEHVTVLCTAQEFVDNAISKTCNVGDHVTFEEFKEIYLKAYRGGAKGCTTYREAGKKRGILKKKDTEEDGSACFFDPATGQKSCG